MSLFGNGLTTMQGTQILSDSKLLNYLSLMLVKVIADYCIEKNTTYCVSRARRGKSKEKKTNLIKEIFKYYISLKGVKVG